VFQLHVPYKKAIISVTYHAYVGIVSIISLRWGIASVSQWYTDIVSIVPVVQLLQYIAFVNNDHCDAMDTEMMNKIEFFSIPEQ